MPLRQYKTGDVGRVAPHITLRNQSAQRYMSIIRNPLVLSDTKMIERFLYS